jgi:hypothetical protein
MSAAAVVAVVVVTVVVAVKVGVGVTTAAVAVATAAAAAAVATAAAAVATVGAAIRLQPRAFERLRVGVERGTRLNNVATVDGHPIFHRRCETRVMSIMGMWIGSL